MSDHEEIELSNEILQLQSQLTASQARVTDLEQTVDALLSSNCNLNDTLRSRGYGHTAGKNTEERFITFVHAFDKAQARVKDLEQQVKALEYNKLSNDDYIKRDIKRIATLEQALREATRWFRLFAGHQHTCESHDDGNCDCGYENALTTISTALKDEKEGE